MSLPNIIIRGIAGIFFIAFLLAGILINEYYFLFVFTVFLALSLYEFYGLMETKMSVSLNKLYNSFVGLILFVPITCKLAGLVQISILQAIGPYMIFVQLYFISELYAKRQNAVQSMAYFTFGQVYLTIPFLLCNVLVFGFSSQFQPIYLLAVFVLIWVNDTFAYLTGRTFGRHKMFERISPKKSWEGFVGGCVFAIGASFLFYVFSDLHNWLIWCVFAFVVVVFGTLGDLLESLIKRTLQVKDSGTMIPGHGGILDRIDSVIFAIPAAVVYLAIVIS